MAGLLDIFGTSGQDTMGLLGMSPEDIQKNRSDAQAQALYALAGRLFQGGRGGASIVEGLQQGQQAYKTAMQGSLQQQLQNAQIQEMLRKRQQEQQALMRQQGIEQEIAKAYRPETFADTPLTNLMGQEVAGPNMPQPSGGGLEALAPRLMTSPEGRKSLTELLAAQEAMGGKTTTLAEGANLIRINPITNKVETVAQGAPKEKSLPAELQGYNFAVGQGYGGSFIDYQTALKKAGAQNTVLNVANKTFGAEFGKGVADSVNAGYQSAQGAVGTLSRIQSLKPLIEGGKVFSGTLGGAQVQASRVADALGIGGANNAERLQNTAVAMQQLAGLELSAAEAMKGQGTITENERGLIKRASGGDLMNMTAKEVSSLLNALEKTSKYKIQVHESNLTRLGQNKELAPLAEYYKLPSVQQNEPPAMPTSGVTVRKTR
jgi:hypothetical protein